jgi:hypothetical protein
MNSGRHFRVYLLAAAIAALGTIATAWPAAAQSVARVVYVPAGSHPPMPAGLQQVCVRASNNGAPPSKTCPIVKYQGITTWAYSYIDNRLSLALVSYDADNNVIRFTEVPGARYVFEALSSDRTQTVMFVGQAMQHVTVPWSTVGPR